MAYLKIIALLLFSTFKHLIKFGFYLGLPLAVLYLYQYPLNSVYVVEKPPTEITQNRILTTKSDGSRVITYDMGEHVGNQEEYTLLVRELGLLSSTDTVIFKLHNMGGSVLSLMYINGAVQTTKAHTIMHVDGLSASAGAMLACLGDELIVAPGVQLMYHTASNQMEGKISDSKAQIEAVESFGRQALKQCVLKGILTDAQVEEIMNGRDYWITPNPLGNKLK